MPFTILQLLGRYWYLVVIGILCVVIGVQNKVIQSKDTKINDLSSLNHSLSSQISTQNDQISKLSEASGIYQANLEQAKVDNAKAQKAADNRLYEIVNSKVPSDCTGAMKWLTDTSRAKLKGW